MTAVLYPRDRPRKAELPRLCNGSRRCVCGCPRFGKKILLMAVRRRGVLLVVGQTSRYGLSSHGPRSCSTKNGAHRFTELSARAPGLVYFIRKIEVLSASFPQSIFPPGLGAQGITAAFRERRRITPFCNSGPLSSRHLVGERDPPFEAFVPECLPANCRRISSFAFVDSRSFRIRPSIFSVNILIWSR
jgi:hypothetical protein